MLESDETIEYHMEEPGEPRGGDREAPLPLLLSPQPLLPPLEAGETVGGGMELVVGVLQDVVALQGIGENLHNMKEGGHLQCVEEGSGRGTSKW